MPSRGRPAPRTPGDRCLDSLARFCGGSLTKIRDRRRNSSLSLPACARARLPLRSVCVQAFRLYRALHTTSAARVGLPRRRANNCQRPPPLSLFETTEAARPPSHLSPPTQSPWLTSRICRSSSAVMSTRARCACRRRGVFLPHRSPRARHFALLCFAFFRRHDLCSPSRQQQETSARV